MWTKFFAVFAAIFGLVACCPKVYPPERIIVRDSLVFITNERLVHDTVMLEIPVIKERIITRDTVSWLSNDYATSYAEVSGGFLTHELDTRPQVIYVPVEIPVRDTIIREVHNDSQKETVEVEKELSRWQQLQMRGFWALLSILIGGILLSLILRK